MEHVCGGATYAGIPDFCISLGGDGTVLYAASLFEDDSPLPPIMAFAMGTLGFLTPFDVRSYAELLERCDAEKDAGIVRCGITLSHFFIQADKSCSAHSWLQ